MARHVFTADDSACKAAPPMSSHHNQGGLPFLRIFDDRFANLGAVMLEQNWFDLQPCATRGRLGRLERGLGVGAQSSQQVAGISTTQYGTHISVADYVLDAQTCLLI